MGHIAVIEQDTNSIGVVHMDDGSEPHLLREELGQELLSGSTSGEQRHDYFKPSDRGKFSSSAARAQALGQPRSKRSTRLSPLSDAAKSTPRIGSIASLVSSALEDRAVWFHIRASQEPAIGLPSTNAVFPFVLGLLHAGDHKRQSQCASWPRPRMRDCPGLRRRSRLMGTTTASAFRYSATTMPTRSPPKKCALAVAGSSRRPAAGRCRRPSTRWHRAVHVSLWLRRPAPESRQAAAADILRIDGVDVSLRPAAITFASMRSRTSTSRSRPTAEC